jgi:hypothetical protein
MPKMYASPGTVYRLLYLVSELRTEMALLEYAAKCLATSVGI